MESRNRNHDVPERLLKIAAMAIARAINEGAYERTIGGNEYHQRIIDEINTYIDQK